MFKSSYKNYVTALLSLILFSCQVFAIEKITGDLVVTNSIKVGGTAVANSTAALELSSITKGLLIPRMTTGQRDAIVGAATGLQVYNTTTNAFNYWDGDSWENIGAGDVAGPGSSTDNGIAVFDGTTGKLLQNSTVTIVGGEIQSATINGNFNTLTNIANSATTATSSNTGSSIVLRDGSGDFSAQTITAALFMGPVTGNVSGNASTASGFDHNPSACAANNFVTDQNAVGALTCAQPAVTNLAALTASRIAITDGSGILSAADTATYPSLTELSYVKGLTSSAQTQITARALSTNAVFAGTFTGPWTTAGPLITSAGGVVTSEASLAIARGGTNNGSLGVTAGGAVYVDGSKLMSTAAGSTGQILTSNGASAPTWSAAPAGGTNDQREYVTNGKFEDDVSDWTTYDDAAAAPVDGSGGTVTTTFTRTTTAGEVLRDTASAELTRDASNRQGEGVCVPWTMDRQEAQGMKPTPVSFEYQTTSGYVTGDILMYVIDVTAATVQAITTAQSTTPGTVTASTSPTRWNGIFYPTTANTSFKLCWHIATTTTAAFDMHIDSVHVGNQNVVPGAIKGTVTTFTPTLINTTNVSENTATYYRDGQHLVVEGHATWSGAGSGAGAWTITIPNSWTIDTAALNATGTNKNKLGEATWFDSGTAFVPVTVRYLSTTTVDFLTVNAAGTNLIGTSFASGDILAYKFKVPITGWSASAALSTSETLMMVSKVRSSTTAGQSIANNTITIVDYGTAATYSDYLGEVTTGASWKYTAKKSGWRFVSARNMFVDSAAWGAGEELELFLYKNGSFVSEIDRHEIEAAGTMVKSVRGADLIYMASGDYIDLRVFQLSGGSLALNNGSGYNFVNIFAIPDFDIFSVYASDRWYVNASITGANPSLGVSNVASYTEIIDAGLTLTPVSGSAAVGVMCSTTNAATAPSTSATTCAAGSESIGINFTIPEPGTYEVCTQFSWDGQADTAEAVIATFQLIETPTSAQTLTLESDVKVQGKVGGMTIATGADASNALPYNLCGLFNWQSAASGTTKGVRLMFEQLVTGSPDTSAVLADANSSVGQRNINFRVRKF